jgi:hypothetical protein
MSGRRVEGLEQGVVDREQKKEKDGEKRLDCPFCELYASEIGVTNGPYKDALYFSIHSYLEGHKLTRKGKQNEVDPKSDGFVAYP